MTDFPITYSMILIISTIAAGLLIFRSASVVQKVFITYLLITVILIPFLYQSGAVFLLYLIPLILTASGYLFTKNLQVIHRLNIISRAVYFAIYVSAGLIFGSLVLFFGAYTPPEELSGILILLLTVLFVLIIRQFLEKEERRRNK